METRNQRPAEGSSLPLVSLLVLVVVVLGLLYIGYSYFAEDDALTMTPQRSRQEQVVSAVEPTQPVVTAPVVTPEPIAGDDEPAGEATGATPPATTGPTYSRSRETGVPGTTTRTEAAKTESKPAETARVSTPAGGTTAGHTIGKGQTIYSVSTRYGIPVKRLEAANPGLTEKNFNSGKTIRVPVRAVHTVGKGDILRVVAQKYGTSVEALMKANGKTKNYTQRGEKLVIPY